MEIDRAVSGVRKASGFGCDFTPTTLSGRTLARCHLFTGSATHDVIGVVNTESTQMMVKRFPTRAEENARLIIVSG